MAKRAKKRRGHNPKYLDIACPNPKCKRFRSPKKKVLMGLRLLAEGLGLRGALFPVLKDQ